MERDKLLLAVHHGNRKKAGLTEKLIGVVKRSTRGAARSWRSA